MKIKLYRIILNVLFYVFYVILTSIVFSFIFPTILVILWQDVISPVNPIFDSIQIFIIVLVLLITLLFRKYFYLPIKEKVEIKKEVKFKEYSKKENLKEKKMDKIKTEDDIQKLEIKNSKEIK